MLAGHAANSWLPPKYITNSEFGLASLGHSSTRARSGRRSLPVFYSSPRIAAATQYGLGRLKGVASKAGNAVAPIASPAVTNPGSTLLSRVGQNEPYAQGGKVKRRPTHEHLVQRLCLLAEQAKKEEKALTKAILNVPDAIVTHALKVANDAI
jgi:hypothetical protein